MINSVLTANIVEARGLKRSSTGYKVLLATEGQTHYSELSTSPSGDPLWKEVVTFDIRTGREPLYIQVIDGEGTLLLGQCEVYLDSLLDQYKHDLWLQLEEPKRQEVAGSIRINMNWMHSRRKFLQDVLRMHDT